MHSKFVHLREKSAAKLSSVCLKQSEKLNLCDIHSSKQFISCKTTVSVKSTAKYISSVIKGKFLSFWKSEKKKGREIFLLMNSQLILEKCSISKLNILNNK